MPKAMETREQKRREPLLCKRCGGAHSVNTPKEKQCKCPMWLKQ